MEVLINQSNFSHELLEEMMPLMRFSYDEVDESGLPYNPNFDFYLLAKDSLCFFTMRDKESDTLVGYSFYFITQNLYSKFFRTASCGSIYILPPYRFYSLKFIKYNLEYIQNEFSVTTINFTMDSKFKKLMDKLGFKNIDYVYTLHK